jgi:hypothetical protein
MKYIGEEVEDPQYSRDSGSAANHTGTCFGESTQNEMGQSVVCSAHSLPNPDFDLILHGTIQQPMMIMFGQGLGMLEQGQSLSCPAELSKVSV